MLYIPDITLRPKTQRHSANCWSRRTMAGNTHDAQWRKISWCAPYCDASRYCDAIAGNHTEMWIVLNLRSNLVKRITLIIYFPPFFCMFCSANLSAANVANGRHLLFAVWIAIVGWFLHEFWQWKAIPRTISVHVDVTPRLALCLDLPF
jgi:hypothetical protein